MTGKCTSSWMKKSQNYSVVECRYDTVENKSMRRSTYWEASKDFIILRQVLFGRSVCRKVSRFEQKFHSLCFPQRAKITVSKSFAYRKTQCLESCQSRMNFGIHRFGKHCFPYCFMMRWMTTVKMKKNQFRVILTNSTFWRWPIRT